MVIIKITNTQKEVSYLYFKKKLSVKQISIRRKTTTRAVYNILKRYNKNKKQNIERSISYVPHIHKEKNENLIRLHGQEYHIKLIYYKEKYTNILNKYQRIEYDDYSIRIYKKSIEVYSNISFYGYNAHDLHRFSIRYWHKVFMELEEKLGITIYKYRKQTIKEVKAHYSEINNELAKDMISKKKKLFIKGSDNKVWLMIDNSLNLLELECIHSITAKSDISSLKKYFDDIRNNNPPTNSQLSVALYALIKSITPKESTQKYIKERPLTNYIN